MTVLEDLTRGASVRGIFRAARSRWATHPDGRVARSSIRATLGHRTSLNLILVQTAWHHLFERVGACSGHGPLKQRLSKVRNPTMVDHRVDQIIQHMAHVAELYHRLVILVAPSGAGKTVVLRSVQEYTRAPLVNVSLELSRQMLGLTERQRALHLPRLLADIVNAHPDPALLLDNIELLFDVSLHQDPLRLLQGLSRNRTLVVAWSGSISEGRLTYATPDHPEYRRYPLEGLVLVGPMATI